MSSSLVVFALNPALTDAHTGNKSAIMRSTVSAEGRLAGGCAPAMARTRLANASALAKPRSSASVVDTTPVAIRLSARSARALSTVAASESDAPVDSSAGVGAAAAAAAAARKRVVAAAAELAACETSAPAAMLAPCVNAGTSSGSAELVRAGDASTASSSVSSPKSSE